MRVRSFELARMIKNYMADGELAREDWKSLSI